MGAFFSAVIVPMLIKGVESGAAFEILKLMLPLAEDPAIKAKILSYLVGLHAAQVGTPPMDHADGTKHGGGH